MKITPIDQLDPMFFVFVPVASITSITAIFTKKLSLQK